MEAESHGERVYATRSPDAVGWHQPRASCRSISSAGSYEPGERHAQFGGRFEPVDHLREVHRTPAGAVQQFVYCHCVLH